MWRITRRLPLCGAGSALRLTDRLLFSRRNLIKNPKAETARLAKFLGIDLTPEELEAVAQHVSEAAWRRVPSRI